MTEPATEAEELPGLRVNIDRVLYQPLDDPNAGFRHAFIYFITIENLSDRTVILLGRKWVIEQADGNRMVIEGDKIVQHTPRLAPGETFSYNSYHLSDQDASAEGAFHGRDEAGLPIFTRIPRFTMHLPTETEQN